MCNTIGTNAFQRCSNLTSSNFPECITIGNSAFLTCSNLTSVDFPKCTNIGSYAFQRCSSLTSASFPRCSYIGGSGFSSCINLSQITVGTETSSVATLAGSNAFIYTPIANSSYLGYFGSIYVLSSLLASYQTATN